MSLHATSLLLLSVAVAALGTGGLAQPAFAVCCALAALSPLRATSTSRERALLLAYGAGAWALFGLAPVLTVGEPLGGPYGGHPWIFTAGLATAIARVIALLRPSVNRWTTPRIPTSSARGSDE